MPYRVCILGESGGGDVGCCRLCCALSSHVLACGGFSFSAGDLRRFVSGLEMGFILVDAVVAVCRRRRHCEGSSAVYVCVGWRENIIY